MSIGKRLLYMVSIDLVVSIFVLAIVVSVFAYQAKDIRTKILVMADTVGMIGELRAPSMTYHAINGEWPKDGEALGPYLPGTWAGRPDRGDEARIENGAITVRMRRIPDANMITIHPAVPAGEPLGPVIWVAGRHSASKDWTVIGEDHTTFPEHKIIHILK